MKISSTTVELTGSETMSVVILEIKYRKSCNNI